MATADGEDESYDYNEEEEEEEEDDADYYGADNYYDANDDDMEPEDEREPDTEYFEYVCLTEDGTRELIESEVKKAGQLLKVWSRLFCVLNILSQF